MNEHDQRDRTVRSLTPRFDSIDTSWEVAIPGQRSLSSHSTLWSAAESPLPSLHLKTPVILRDDAIRRVLELDHLPDEVHVKLASCIQRVGGALLATVDDLASVPLREIPVRIAPIDVRSMPNVDSILSSDAIELQLGDWSSSLADSQSNTSLRSLCIDWPLDTPDLLRLAKKIELFRCLSNFRVPVGVALPIGNVSEAGVARFQWLSEMDIDFVTIRSPVACLGSRHTALAYFHCDPIELVRLTKKLLDRSGRKTVAIVIDHPWSDGFQAGQAILSGASFVGVGSFLASCIPSNLNSSSTRSMDSLAHGLLGRSSLQATSLSTASVSYFLQKVDLNSVMSAFNEQLRSAVEYVL